MSPIPILLSAGEASGDMYAAWLATALRQRADVALFGMGGQEMRAAGVDVVTDYSEVSVVGIAEVLKRLPSLRRAMRRLVTAAEERHPALAILTDFPGFHLRLARKLKRRGVQNVYYICPQFWAWRPWRVNLVRRRFAEALCIFPFEEKFYADAGVPVKFIGHPLVGHVRPSLPRDEFCAKHGLKASERILALLPGSRRGEISHHLPVLLKGLERIKGSCAESLRVVVAVAPGLHAAQLQAKFPADLGVRFLESETYNILAAADVAVVSSGTATVEAALLDVPMAVIYRLAPLTAALAKPLLRTPYFSMVNLIAERRVVPELIQNALTPERLANETLRLLQDAQARLELRRGLAEVRERLGPPGAVERAADAILHLLQKPTGNAL